MQELTARERVKNLLERKPAGRSAFMESICPETVARWNPDKTLKELVLAQPHTQADLLLIRGIGPAKVR